METVTYHFAKQYTQFPGGRHIEDGEHSGAHFLTVLEGMARKPNVVHVLDLTGVMGFATSFLDGAFGEYAARYSGEKFYRHFRIKCDDDPTLAREILACVKRADNSYTGNG